MPRVLKQKSVSPRSKAKKKIVDHPNRGSIWLFILGGLLLYSSYYLRNHKSQLTSVLSSDFSAEPVKFDREITQLPLGIVPTRVLIPILALDVSVVPSQIKNGYWEVPQNSAGFGLGSAAPGSGNTVIFAHARANLFLPLSRLSVGQQVYVIATDRVFTYQVDSIKSVYPQQIEVIYPSKEPILTLYTCSGFLDQKRLVITAKLL